jgi:ribosomal-protein-alanine N-acetyltransferase
MCIVNAKSAFEEGRFYAIALEDEGLPVGIVTFSVACDTADIEVVVVISDKRKKGYGLKLVERAEQQMKELGVVKSFLEVREGNIPAQCLYNKAGYNKISVRKGYYSDGENAIVMIKELV